MNKKKLLIILLALILLIISACGGSKGILLQEEAVNVEEAIIYYDDGTKIELDMKDEKELSDLAKALANTKTEEKTIDMSIDAEFFTTYKYAIDLTYTDTTVEKIFSGADGVYFYRFINNDEAYLGGENSKISKILEEIKSNHVK